MLSGPARASRTFVAFAALPPHSHVTLPLYLRLLTFVVAVDLTITASDVEVPSKTNKNEGLVLSPGAREIYTRILTT